MPEAEIHDPLAALPRERTDWLFVVGATIVMVVCALAVVGPYIGPYDPTLTTQNVAVPPPTLSEIPGLLRGADTMGAIDEPLCRTNFSERRSGPGRHRRDRTRRAPRARPANRRDSGASRPSSSTGAGR